MTLFGQPEQVGLCTVSRCQSAFVSGGGAEPFGNLKALGMAAALVTSHLAEVIVLCLHFDRYCAFTVGVRDVVVRQLLKICIFETLSRDRMRSS
jgi:hypothetical protein